MRICLLFLALSSSIILPAASNRQSGQTWDRLMQKYRGNDNDLKKEMKEQLISDFVYASYDPDRKDEVKMFVEMMHRCMNGNNDDIVLSREFLYATLCAFRETSPEASIRAEMLRDQMTITDQELTDTKQTLRPIVFDTDLNGQLQKNISLVLPACKDIACNETPEDLKKRVDEGTLSEEQIVRCMHARTLVTLAAFCLLADRTARKGTQPTKCS